MSQEAGHMERVDIDGKPTVYRGEFEMLAFQSEFWLIPHDKKSENDRDFKVKVRAGGKEYDIGGAWKKDMRAGGFLFSVTLRDATINQGNPLNLSIFPDDDQPSETDADNPAFFTVKTQRPRRNGAGQASASIGDEIPW